MTYMKMVNGIVCIQYKARRKFVPKSENTYKNPLRRIRRSLIDKLHMSAISLSPWRLWLPYLHLCLQSLRCLRASARQFSSAS